MILPIVKYGDPVLTKKCTPVTEFNEDLRKLVADMFETMYAAPGVGLAAPQIGVSKRIFVMDCSGGKNPEEKFALINPKIVGTEGTQTGDEGCLSFPNIYFEVTRPKRLIAKAFDVEGKEFTIDAMDLTARCIAHENDHLNGELFIQYLGMLKRELVMRKIKKRIKLGDWK
jgi:peptide deformylase